MRCFPARASGQQRAEHGSKHDREAPYGVHSVSSVMHRNTTHRPCRAVGTSRHSALGSNSVDQPHANTVTDMAAGCTALDHGYATWFSHQVEEVIAREEEGDLAADGRLPHSDRRDR